MSDTSPDQPESTIDPIDALLGAADDHAAERARLEAAIAAANSRVAAARHRIATNDAAIRSSLRDEVLATQALLADMDRQHQAALSALRIATQAEIELINAKHARREPGAH